MAEYRGRSTWSLGRMKKVALCLSLLAAMANAGAASAAEEPMAIPELVREVRSYGEERRDLAALFVPFLSAHGFHDSSTMPDAWFFDETVTFGGDDGDFVGVRGRYNCIVLVYYSTLREPKSRRRSIRSALDEFEAAMADFVARLPSPKLAVRSLTWGDPKCPDAT